jgi:4-hydroxy-tetrahydrodipicolinate synthase
LLVPGSTGEGWGMSDLEIRELLEIVLLAAGEFGIKVLIGVLKTDCEQALACIDRLDDLIQHTASAGITICPPKGAGVSQFEILEALRRILRKKIPTALYQLPQVTLNEMAPATVAELAGEFPNFYLFKDTSGNDRVAKSNLDLQKVFLVRGSEQAGYSQWTKAAGGPYDGFLLSTANALSPELAGMLDLLEQGDVEAAEKISTDLQRLVTEAFELVQPITIGNAFTNANKVLVQLRQFGRLANDHPMPMLHSGERLPRELMQQAVKLLDRYSWLHQ